MVKKKKAAKKARKIKQVDREYRGSVHSCKDASGGIGCPKVHGYQVHRSDVR